MGIGIRSVYWVEVLRLIPTAEYIAREKLDAVLSWFDPEDLSLLQPLTVTSAVSYTHLDVYKRQRDYCRRCRKVGFALPSDHDLRGGKRIWYEV